MGYDSMFTSTRRTSEIDWSDWPSAVDAFQQRYEEWYFNPLIEIQKTGHEAFLVYFTCGMLVANLSTFIYDSAGMCSSILRCLDTSFAEPVYGLVFRMNSGQTLWGDVVQSDVADVILDSFESIDKSSSMGRMCALSGTGEIVIIQETDRGPRVIIDPWVFRDRIREFFLSYCDYLRLNPHSAKSRMFRKMMKEHLGITITLTPTVSWPDNQKEEVKSGPSSHQHDHGECSHEEGCGTPEHDCVNGKGWCEHPEHTFNYIQRVVDQLNQFKETLMTKDDFQTEINTVTTKLDGAVSLLHELKGLIGSGVQDGATPADLQAWHDTLEAGLAKLQTEVDADTPPAPVEPVG